jgi:hypothetical protein
LFNWDAGGLNWDASPSNIWDGESASFTQDTSDFKVGTSSVKITVGSGDIRSARVDLSIKAGMKYRWFGWYKVEGSASAKLRVGTSVGSPLGATSIVGDGRNYTNTQTFLELDGISGEWRRFVFDFVANSDSQRLVIQANGTSGEGIVWFDGLELRPIFRYNWYEPRISSSSLPSIDTGSNDIFFGGKSIGSGSVSLMNHDGFLERLVAELEWMNQNVLIDVGGQFIDTPQPIMADDWFRGFTGLVQDLTATDTEVTFNLQDQRVFFHIKLPPRLYDDQDFANMDLRKQGAVRPLFFGAKENINPVRIDKSATTGYGTYELADTLEAPNGIAGVSVAYTYIDSTAAGIQQSSERLQLSQGVDYSVDTAAGSVTVLRDVGPYVINDRDRRLNFDEGSTELTAVLTSGFYTATSLATEIQTQIRAVGSADLTCVYSDTTHKFTIAKGAGTLNLLIKTGTNADSSPWFQLGFDKGSDKTGSLSYTAEDPTFEDVDRDHVLRFNATGYKDDTAGTFTGTSGALIEIGSDILRMLLVNYMKKDSSIADEASFLFARQRAPETLSLYLNSSISTKDIFDRLEFSNIANIIVNGQGKVFYKVYVGDIPAEITILRDSDFESFESSRSNSEVFTTIRVKYDQDPTTGNFEAREATDSSVIVRLGRPDLKEFETFIKRGDNAISAAGRMLELSKFAARKVSATSLGSKLLKLEVGDKFQLSRDRAIARGGKILNEVFRLISISKNPLDGRVSFIATDDRITVASQACIVSCQQLCENTCQEECEVVCQLGCQLTCEDGCENTCQVTCEQTGQEECQLGCQETCETECQVGCQIVCEVGCQGPSCQTNCEATCQGCGQTSCQTVCQTGCQGSCQVSCQDACETNPCQNSCQTGSSCQNNCQTGITCQETCETNCQDGCQTGCQGGCQTAGCQAVSEGI